MENYREEIVLWLNLCVKVNRIFWPNIQLFTSVNENLNMYIPILRKEEGKDQESIQSSTTPDPVHSMGKWHIQEGSAVAQW